MRKICMFLLLATVMVASAQTKKTFSVKIWEGTDNTDADRNTSTLYCYLPENPCGKAVVVCPGGGYGGLCMDYEGTDFAEWFNEFGVAGFVLQYRMPGGRSEVPMADAQQAVAVVRKHAKEWGIDEKAIGIMGSSAGGHLAATLSTRYTSQSGMPNFQILLYPVITMDETYTHMGSRNNLLGTSPKASAVRNYSCEKQVKTSTPQAFIAVSAADELVPVKNSLQYTQALIDKNVPVSLHVYPGGFHGFGDKDTFEDAKAFHYELQNWLDEEVKATVPDPSGDPEEPEEPQDPTERTDGLLKSVSQLSDNCYWVYAALDMSVNALLDGSTTTHFHSDANNKTPLSSLNQYIQMDLLEEQSGIQLYFAGRDLKPIGPVSNPNITMINNPNHIMLYTTNTPEDESSWTLLADLKDGFPGVCVAGEYWSPELTLETPQRYLRMVVKGADQSEFYWNISELQVYPLSGNAVQNVKASTLEDTMYTLDGRKASSVDQHGIYVVGNKKIKK